jgi:hypothetical protein
MDIRKRSSIGSVRESELPIVPLPSQRQHNFERGKGQYLHHVSEGVKERRLRQRYKLQEFQELQRKLYQKAKQE